jgi:hypothetical protein
VKKPLDKEYLEELIDLCAAVSGEAGCLDGAGKNGGRDLAEMVLPKASGARRGLRQRNAARGSLFSAAQAEIVNERLRGNVGSSRQIDAGPDE